MRFLPVLSVLVVSNVEPVEGRPLPETVEEATQILGRRKSKKEKDKS
jgi:hypothetical protein